MKSSRSNNNLISNYKARHLRLGASPSPAPDSISLTVIKNGSCADKKGASINVSRLNSISKLSSQITAEQNVNLTHISTLNSVDKQDKPTQSLHPYVEQ